MPTTINGIGTRYCGKHAHEARLGTCKHCGATVRLETYETRLWFVILFLPVIPLRRLQILDCCPRCTRHQAIPVRKWREIQREAAEESRQALAAGADADALMQSHATLLGCRMYDDADRVAAELKDRFGDRAEVQLHLGGGYERTGRRAEADACFEEALALEPENRDARRAVAIGCIQRGDLERARSLLAYMDEPGEKREAPLLAMLAEAHHGQGRHGEALAFYRKALEAEPRLAKDRRFRKAVTKVERLAGGPSVLPQVPLLRRPLFLLSAGVAAVLVALTAVNGYIAGHRTLHVVSGLPVAVTVQVDDREAERLDPFDRRTFPCGEGDHQAVVTYGDGDSETVAFTMRTGWWDRFFCKPVFVLNVGGGALLIAEVTTYTARPPREDVNPHTLHLGEDLAFFRHVDYPFRDFPPTLTTTSDTELKKTRVDVIRDMEPAAAFLHFRATESHPPDVLLRFAESHLRARPDDEALLQAYGSAALEWKKADRSREFFGRGLAHRPVRMEWHRQHQRACSQSGRGEGLAATYDRFLAAEPGSASLLYLRGRCAPKTAEAMAYLERSIAADPGLPYPWFGKGYHLMAKGEFRAAREAYAEACRLKPGDDAMESGLYTARLALGEYDGLLQETTRQQAERPLDLTLQGRLLEVLAAAGRLGDARAAHEQYAERVRDHCREHAAELSDDQAEQLVLYSRFWLGYLEGDLAGILDFVEQVKAASTAEAMRLQARLELGQTDKAAEAVARDQERWPWRSLFVSLAYLAHGDRAQADQWRERARQEFAGSGQQERQIADLLAKGPAVTMADVDDVQADPPSLATLLAVLADRCPQHRAGLLDRAGKLNFSRYFPHRLLNRAIRTMREAPPE